MRHQNYKRVLLYNNVEYCTNTIIRKTVKFGPPQLNTMDIKKVCLDVWYDKRKIVKRKVYNSDLKLVQWNLNHIHTEPYDSPSVRTSIQSRLENNMCNRAESHDIRYNLGCDVKKFMEYVSNKFRVGMCWRNYGVKWELDHIIPVSFVKSEEFKRSAKRNK